MLNVVMLSFVMLNVVMLGVVMLNVVAPFLGIDLTYSEGSQLRLWTMI